MAMEHLNYFDFISFPDRAERDKIRKTYFDTHELRICDLDFDALYDKGNLANLKLFAKYSKLKDKINYFNNTVVYLDLAVLKMVNYFDLLKNDIKDKEEKDIREILYRQSCRNVSCEVYIYEEKIKDFLRYIFKFDKTKTKSDNKFFQALGKACENIPYGKEFLVVADTYHKNENVIAIKSLRNDEVHNSTRLLMTLEENNSDFNNNELFQKIKFCLNAMVELKNGLYSFIVNYFDL